MFLSIIKSIFFLLFFTASFVGMHYYSFYRLLSIYIPKFKPYTLFVSLFTVFLVFLFFATSMFFNKSFFALPHRLTYFWFGFIFFLFFTTLITHAVSLVITVTPKQHLCILIFLTISVVSYALFEGGRLHTKHIELTSDKIKQPYTVALLSDIHIGSNPQKFLSKIVQTVTKARPDYVVIVGDFIDRNNVTPKDLQVFRSLTMPVYYTYGNHEFYIKPHTAEKAVQNTNITLLRNKVIELEDLQNIGLDGSRRHEGNLRKNIEKISINPSKYSILLYHQPQDIDVAINNKIDLMLSGHTHAGQIFPFTLFVRLAYKYFYGLYDFGNTKLYVTSGTGVWGPRMRLGSQNEVVVIRLEPKK